jgi:tetratricopeptide (TPR) repeat protein
LAADVEHWLADEPVTALRESLGPRLARWGRKHPKLLGKVGAGLGSAALALAVGLAVVQHAQQQTQKARLDAERNATMELRERDRAETARTRTRQALDAMTSQVTGDALERQPELSAAQKHFLKEVLTYYREFAGEQGDDAATMERVADAALRVSSIEYRLGRKKEALAACRQQLALRERLAADFPDVPRHRHHLANSRRNLGLLLRDLGQLAEAEAAFRQALALREKLAADFPKVPDYQAERAASGSDLGLLLKNLGKWKEAKKAYQQALASYQKLTTRFPSVPAYQHDHARCRYFLGNLLRDEGEPAEALPWYAQAIAQFTPLVQNEPSWATTRHNLRNAQWGRAQALEKLQRHAPAAADWGRAAVLDAGPQRPYFQRRRALALVRAGQTAQAVAAVEELTAAAKLSGADLYDAASVLALAAATKAHVSLADRYAAGAVALLRRSRDAGYFQDTERVAHLQRDSDLDSLRSRAEFLQFVAELEKK